MAPHPRSPSRLLVLALPLLGAGCYSVGFQPAAGLSEVAVPVFENLTLRREVEHDLTRLVREEILENTSLHLARQGSARAVLRGAVTSVNEGVLVSGPAEEVLASSVTVSARFGVYEGRRLLVGDDTDGDGAPDAEFVLLGFAEFNAARGESRESATDEALRDLAEAIAYNLTDSWDDRFEPNDDARSAPRIEAGRQVALRQRDPDWFLVEVPPRTVLRARIVRGPGLRLVPHTASGGPLPKAERRDANRAVELFAGEGQRTFCLEVTGRGEGARYELEVETSLDDGAEPDSTPAEASRLPGGQRSWRRRGLQRNDDYVSLAVPRGVGLKASLLGSDRLRLVLCDSQGATHRWSQHAEDGHSAVLRPLERSERVLVRVEGDDLGRAYVLRIELQEP